ncbi:hypothetical protein [Cytobacillus gottheilii]|uniref:hypothetical protein n=1 Tax=Cytobacillus gottheilii TaxID=859144 RepID=UPI0009BA550B|nr:hypothetical protein [Cytobacillus gottheilii]
MKTYVINYIGFQDEIKTAKLEAESYGKALQRAEHVIGAINETFETGKCRLLGVAAINGLEDWTDD